MIALVISVLIHPVIPQYRWLLVHMVTLGLITTSILVWGQHFTEALLKTRLGPESRPNQVRRIRVLTLAIVVTMVGMVGSWPWVTTTGSLGVSLVLLWFALSLGRQVKAALAPRFTFVVRAYLTAACLLPIGAALGSILSFSPGEPWQGRLLLAHQIVNILGFVGVSVSATILTLWPTILRTKIDGSKAARASRSLVLMTLGTLLSALGAAAALPPLGIVGLALYLAGQVSILGLCANLTHLAWRQRGARAATEPSIPLFPVLSIGMGLLWYAATTISLVVMWVGSVDRTADVSPASGFFSSSLLATDISRLTVPFVVGFLLQVLLGAMSYLMPTVIGGGPRALKASLVVMSRGAVFRIVTLNLVLALFVFSSMESRLGYALFALATMGIFGPDQFGSVARVLVSLAAFGVLASFLVLMMRMVKVNVRERREFAQRVELGMPTAGISTAELPDPKGPEPPRPTFPDTAQRTVDRRRVASALVGAGSVMGLAAMGRAFDGTLGSAGTTSGGSAPSSNADATAVAPTGRTTRGKVEATEAMRFVPHTIEVPAGDRLILEVHNTDTTNVHDLVLASGATTGRISPGTSASLDCGVIDRSLDGWCSIVGHRAMGMTFAVVAVGAPSEAGQGGSSTEGSDGGGADVGSDPLSRVTADLVAPPGPSHEVRDPKLPEVGPHHQALTLTASGAPREIAPGVKMDAMMFNGQVMGPTIVSPLGGRIDVTLANDGSMGHSIDFHAGHVSPTDTMRTIPPGDTLHYPFTTDYAGIWLYHCSTAPMSLHLASGMFGALVVPPQGLAAADREYVLVQSEHYLDPQPRTTDSGADATSVHAVSSAKIAAERPDFTVFNGHATQYQHAPLEARVGERVRIWVLAAGPSRGITFHVVGGIFDTVFKEGAYLLQPDNDTGGGSQALDLGPCQGGFVDMVFTEPGTYKAVNHSFVDLERGALARITVTH